MKRIAVIALLIVSIAFTGAVAAHRENPEKVNADIATGYLDGADINRLSVNDADGYFGAAEVRKDQFGDYYHGTLTGSDGFIGQTETDVMDNQAFEDISVRSGYSIFTLGGDLIYYDETSDFAEPNRETLYEQPGDFNFVRGHGVSGDTLVLTREDPADVELFSLNGFDSDSPSATREDIADTSLSTSNSYMYDVATDGQYVAITVDDDTDTVGTRDGIWVYEISGDTITQIARDTDAGSSNGGNIAVSEGYAYYQGGSTNDLEVFDLSNITATTNRDITTHKVGEVGKSTSGDMSATTDYLYAMSNDNINVYDISEPETINITSVDVGAEATDLDQEGDYYATYDYTVTATYENGTTVPVSELNQSKVNTGANGYIISVNATEQTYETAKPFDPTILGNTTNITVEAYGVTGSSDTISVSYRDPYIALTSQIGQQYYEPEEPINGFYTVENNGYKELDTRITATYETTDGTVIDTLLAYNDTVHTISYGRNNLTIDETAPTEEGIYDLRYEAADPVNGTVQDSVTVRFEVINTTGAPTIEIINIDTTPAKVTEDGTATFTVKNNQLQTAETDVTGTIRPEFTNNTQSVSFGDIGPQENATTTVTLTDQPPGDVAQSEYTFETVDDSATFIIDRIVEAATLQNLRNPQFTTMDRVIAVLGNTNLIILFLLTGASAMISKETSGTVGSALFAILLLPAWLAIGMPLYLFAIALPAVVVIYKQSQSDQAKTEVHVQGIR